MTAITRTELGATGRYINLGSPAALDDKIKTIICYCRPTAYATASYLVSKTPSGSTSGPRFYLVDAGSGKYLLNYGAHSTTTANPLREGAGGVSATTNSWRHLIATDDGGVSAAGLHVLINGTSEDGSGTSGSGGRVSDAGNDLYLMNRGDSGSLAREFIGDVAYWAFYDAVLDSTQITNATTNGPLSESTNLICVVANGTVYSGPQDSGNTITITARSTAVDGALPPNTDLGELPVATVLSGEAVLPGITAEGGMATAGTSELSGDAVLSGIGAEGGMGLAPGVITTPVLKNNTGTILASVSGIVANIYHPTTGVLVVRKTGLSSDGSGIVTISDVLLSAGTTYAYELDLSATSQGRRLPTGVAA